MAGGPLGLTDSRRRGNDGCAAIRTGGCWEGNIRLQSASSRWLAGAALAIVIVASVGVAVALLNSSKSSALLPEGTPEGTVHRFLLAIEQGQTLQAFDLLSPELQETCTYQHFRDSVRWLDKGSGRGARDLRVTLQGTESINGAVEVRVRIIRFNISPSSPLFLPLSGNEYSHSERFTLEMTGGAWVFVDPPWPMGWCPDLKRGPQPALPPVPALE